MSRCPHRRKQIICSRISGPHCDTCCCSGEYRETIHEVASCSSCSCETTTKIFEPISGNCNCNCHVWKDKCLFCLHSKTPFSNPRTEDWDKFLACTNRTYTILKHWFKRFDSNEDGYLDFNELKGLIIELGPGTLQNTQMVRLLHRADSDRDGRLSFVEYLRMWEAAALNEINFLNVTNCRDLNVIIREYNLFPEERCAHKFDIKFVRNSKVVDDSLHGQSAIEPTICDCGYEEVKIFVDPNRKDNIAELDQGKQNDEKIPILSKNRSPASSPPYNSDERQA